MTWGWCREFNTSSSIRYLSYGYNMIQKNQYYFVCIFFNGLSYEYKYLYESVKKIGNIQVCACLQVIARKHMQLVSVMSIKCYSKRLVDLCLSSLTKLYSYLVHTVTWMTLRKLCIYMYICPIDD